MLQLIVLGHEMGQNLGKFLDLGCQLQLADQSVCVLLQLFWFDFFISIDVIDSLVEVLDFLSALLILSHLVVLEVF